jgi:hypothetical protein
VEKRLKNIIMGEAKNLAPMHFRGDTQSKVLRCTPDDFRGAFFHRLFGATIPNL